MARTGQDESQQANQQLSQEQTQAFNTQQQSIAAGQAALRNLMRGGTVAPNPYLNPTYLSNVNKMQAESLNSANDATKTQLENLNRRTGGLNTGATRGAIVQSGLQKAQLADQLSAERSASDYQKNLEYQQQQLNNLYTPAQIESGTYSTATSGRDAALGDLTQFGLASYGPWQSAISAAGAAAGGAFGH